jgi:hypothetical protein
VSTRSRPWDQEPPAVVLHAGNERDLRFLHLEAVVLTRLRWIEQAAVPFEDVLGTMIALREGTIRSPYSGTPCRLQAHPGEQVGFALIGRCPKGDRAAQSAPRHVRGAVRLPCAASTKSG